MLISLYHISLGFLWPWPAVTFVPRLYSAFNMAAGWKNMRCCALFVRKLMFRVEVSPTFSTSGSLAHEEESSKQCDSYFMAVPLTAWVWEGNSHVTTFRKHILSVRLHITASNSFSRERFVMVKSCCSETRSSWGWYSKLEKRRFWVIFSETSRHAPTLHETEFGRFDTSRFDSLKSFRDIVKVDSIHVESRFDSTQPLCSQLFSGPTGAKIAIPVSQWRCSQAPTVMKTLSIPDSFEGLDKNCRNH